MASAIARTQSITRVATGRGVNLRHLMQRPVRRLSNQYEQWRFHVVPRKIVGSVRDCVELRGKIFLCDSVYAPNSIFIFFLSFGPASVTI